MHDQTRVPNRPKVRAETKTGLAMSLAVLELESIDRARMDASRDADREMVVRRLQMLAEELYRISGEVRRGR